jgi:hypothetical protein
MKIENGKIIETGIFLYSNCMGNLYISNKKDSIQCGICGDVSTEIAYGDNTTELVADIFDQNAVYLSFLVSEGVLELDDLMEILRTNIINTGEEYWGNR